MPEEPEKLKPPPLADDLLEGAAAIAEWTFGDRRHVRRVYHLSNASRFPFFRFAGQLCARKSVVLAWLAEQEAAHSGH